MTMIRPNTRKQLVTRKYNILNCCISTNRLVNLKFYVYEKIRREYFYMIYYLEIIESDLYSM